MTSLYNENDKFAARWLRNLIGANLIPPGMVDERSICDVQPSDVAGFRQVHLFAGISGWPLALQLARWDEPCWTGSCPCQPFSDAGKRGGESDPRHLWPQMFRLVRECRPATIFGEQVASKDGLGWLDGVFADLEGIDYACGAAVLPACSVGAPHRRLRIFWTATTWKLGDTDGARQRARRGPQRCERGEAGESLPATGIGAGVLVNSAISGIGTFERKPDSCDGPQQSLGGSGSFERIGDGLEHAAGDGREQGRAESIGRGVAGGRGIDIVGHASGAGLARRPSEPRDDGQELAPLERAGDNAWSDSAVIDCRDGKRRRVPLEPAFFPLAPRLPGRVGRLRGYGNSIVPQCAAKFVIAFMESLTPEQDR